jgi:hypothetical protein
LGINASRCNPLPATIVASEITVNQTVCEKLFAMLPVVEQMFLSES